MLRRLAFPALAFAVALVPGALPPPERLHATGLVQESVWIPAPGGYSIATHVLRPPGRGPFPAIVLFHYAVNDRFFNSETSRLWFERFSHGGAQADYVLQPPFGDDGHFIFTAPSGQRHWLPEVDRFLRKHGMVPQHQRSL